MANQKTLVSLVGFSEIDIEELEGTFKPLNDDVKFLGNFLPLEGTKSQYEGRASELDYFPNEIIVQRKFDSLLRTHIHYTIIYHAKVIGDVANSRIVGTVTYTGEEVKRMREKYAELKPMEVICEGFEG